MAILYLLEQNTMLRKRGDQLLVCQKPPVNRYSPGVRESDILLELPCADVEHVMVYGNVQITTQAMHHLLSKGIELALFTLSGQLLGQITPPVGKNIFLRLKQYDRYRDPAFRLVFAQEIVSHKISNSLAVIRNHEKNHPGSLDEKESQDLQKYAAKARTCPSMESLLGIEGSASALYFKILGRLLPDKWRFTGRSRRPPQDPANAVMSFGYTVLGNELSSLIDGQGLDPGLGFFHETDYGRPSLALDLLELFRAPVIDRLLLNLFNLNSLQEEHFVRPPEGGVLMNDEGKKKFFNGYERMLGAYQDDIPDDAEKVKFRAVFQQQTAALAKSIEDNAPFQAFSLTE